MTTSHSANPNNSADAPNLSLHTARTPQRWPVILVACGSIYYLLSALTLPFVNKLWFGEFPPLALFQLPKSFLKSVVQTVLMSAMHSLGMSHGSFSPDYMATHTWAMAITTAAPVLLIITLLTCLRNVPNRRTLIAVILASATFDAVVTHWFDTVSSLKLFNASYF